MAVTNLLLPAEATMSASGTQDDFDFGNTSLLRCDNASAVTLRGLLAGRPGQVLTLVSVGAGQIDIANDNTNSAAANRILTGVSGTISLAAGAGCCNLLYDGTSERWRIVNHEQGAWITPAFTAADYNGNGSMTWTVDSADVTSAAYYLRGRVLHINIMIVNSSVGGTPNTELQRVIPGGFTAFRSADIVNFRRDNGTFFADGICHVNAGESVLRLFRNPSFQNWQASNNQSNISVCAALAVQ